MWHRLRCLHNNSTKKYWEIYLEFGVANGSLASFFWSVNFFLYFLNNTFFYVFQPGYNRKSIRKQYRPSGGICIMWWCNVVVIPDTETSNQSLFSDSWIRICIRAEPRKLRLSLHPKKSPKRCGTKLYVYVKSSLNVQCYKLLWKLFQFQRWF